MSKRKIKEDEYDENDSFLSAASDEEEMKPPKSTKRSNERKDYEVDSDYYSKSASSRSTIGTEAKKDYVKAELEKVNESLREAPALDSDVSDPEDEESLSEGATSNEEDSSSDEEEESGSETKKPSSESTKIDNSEQSEEESEEEWDATKSLKGALKSKKKKNIVAKRKSQREKSSRVKQTSEGKQSDGNDSISSVEIGSDSEEKQQDLEINQDAILDMWNNASHTEFLNLSNVSKARWETIIAERPFESYEDLNEKLKKNKISHLSTQVIEMLNARKIVNSLMQKCKQISNEVKRKIERVVDTNLDNLEANHKLIRQPKVLSTKMQLKSYQVIGMNWLILMHEQKLNSILADEMGLGKTCQTIAFFAHIYETNPNALNLIVVPASTLDNWTREIRMWFPKYLFIVYKGDQMVRREIRDDIKKLTKKKKLNAILTTYE